jgi:hypothetical protein
MHYRAYSYSYLHEVTDHLPPHSYRYAHQQNWTPEFELQDFFGQILCFLIVNIPPSPEHSIEAKSFIYAAIHEVRISEPATDRCRINYYQDLGPMVLVDLDQVKCVVGCIRDRNKWAIIDQSGPLVQVHVT